MILIFKDDHNSISLKNDDKKLQKNAQKIDLSNS